jgi:hypothetical protein
MVHAVRFADVFCQRQRCLQPLDGFAKTAFGQVEPDAHR